MVETYLLIRKNNGGGMDTILIDGSAMPVKMIACHYLLRCSYQLHGSVMANKSFLTNFEFSRFQEKRFIPLYTQLYVWICLFLSVPTLLYGKKSDSSYFTTNVAKVLEMNKCYSKFLIIKRDLNVLYTEYRKRPALEVFQGGTIIFY